MIELLDAIVEYGSKIVQSEFAVALLLLTGFVLSSVTLRKTVARVRQELRIALLECKEDSLFDVKCNASLLAIASKYQTAMMTLTGERRAVPPIVNQLAEELRDLRKRMHDETNRRQDRVSAARLALQQQHRDQGLQ